MSAVRRIVLEPSQLSTVNVGMRCEEPGCGETFTSSSNLGMHMVKRHKVGGFSLNKREVNALFHCPEADCKYSKEKGRFFKRATLLKQHYLKVHAARSFPCAKCSRGFATEAACSYHSSTCGQTFPCSCGVVYNSREALRTHAKRKKHAFTMHMTSAKPKTDPEPARTEGVPVHLLAAVALSELSRPIRRETGVQTEESRPKRKSLSPARAAGTSVAKVTSKRRASTHTQTLASKLAKTSTETQTTGDVILRKAMMQANIPVKLGKRKKHSETQTLRKNVSNKAKTNGTQTQVGGSSCNYGMSFNVDARNKSLSVKTEDDLLEKSSDIELKTANLREIDSEIPLKEYTTSRLIINDVSLPDIWLNQKSTQTSPTEQNMPCFSPFRTEVSSLDTLLTDDKFQSSETQTELAEFNDSFLEDCDTNFTLCSHIETQTCDELNESFEEMLHSNMYTQTCDELLMDFVDIQTQTWPENLSDSQEAKD